MKRIYIFLNKNIGETLTGIETAVLKRAKLFEEELDILPIYLQTNFDLGYFEILDKLKQRNRISENFNYISLYENYQKSCENVTVSNALQFEQELSNEYVLKNGQKIFYKEHIKCNDKIVITHFYNIKTKKLSYSRHHDKNGKLARIDNYDYDGYLSRIVDCNSENQMGFSETYFRRDGRICIYKHFRHNDKKEKLLDYIYLYDANGHVIKIFANESELMLFLLVKFLNNYTSSDEIVLFAERDFEFLESNLEKYQIIPKIKLISVIHAYHLKEANNLNSDLLGRQYLNRLKDMTAVITLTEQQKTDIVSRFGDFSNVYAIGHSVDYFPPKTSFESRKKHSACYVGRLAQEKRIDGLIRIFSHVVQKIPTASLSIYGHGSLKMQLQKQIDDLSMQNNIKIYDFVDNVYDVFAEHQVSLINSRSEGFCLSILESLTTGTPVISSNCLYGPADLIKNDFNGYLIDVDDEKSFADKIISLFNNPKLNKTLSLNSYKIANKFSNKSISLLYKKMLESI